MSVVWTIIILSVLIVVHEFGHFLLARLNGVRVEEFALGMGPKILGRVSKKGTFFAWRLFPIGGYCKMSGEDGGEGDDEGAFYNKSVPRRIGIIVAGPLMNFVLAFVLFIFAFMGMGAVSYTHLDVYKRQDKFIKKVEEVVSKKEEEIMEV